MHVVAAQATYMTKHACNTQKRFPNWLSLRARRKDEDSDDEDDEPGGFITKRKAKAGKREKKGFASEF